MRYIYGKNILLFCVIISVFSLSAQDVQESITDTQITCSTSAQNQNSDDIAPVDNDLVSIDNDQEYQAYDEICAQTPQKPVSMSEKMATKFGLPVAMWFMEAQDFMYKKYMLAKYLVSLWWDKDEEEVGNGTQQTKA